MIVGTLPVVRADVPAALKSVCPIITYDPAGKAQGEGSAVICSSNGTAVTCFHVLEDAAFAKVRLSGEEEVDVIGFLHADPVKDFVVLQLSPSTNYQAIAIRSSSNMAVGDKVYTIGNPRGLAGTLADGIISALRDTKEFGKVIQTTAPISQGSSGGALLDSAGHLIGITKFYMRDAQNLNFATPIDDIVPFLAGHSVKPLKALPPALTQVDAARHADELLSVIAEGGIFTRVALVVAGKPESLKKNDSTFPIYIIGLIENAELSKAETEIRDFYASRPGNNNVSLAIAYFYLAKANLEDDLGNKNGANALFRRAAETAYAVLKNDNTNRLACSLYFRALWGLGEYELLEQKSAAAVRMFPDSHFPWRMRLYGLAFTGRYEDARRFSDALISNKKMDRGSVYYLRGMVKVLHIREAQRNSQNALARGLATEALVDFQEAANSGNPKEALEGMARLQKMGYFANE
jgi:tetratricopeptide (TPR) repeat protein